MKKQIIEFVTINNSNENYVSYMANEYNDSEAIDISLFKNLLNNATLTIFENGIATDSPALTIDKNYMFEFNNINIDEAEEDATISFHFTKLK